MKRDMSKQPKEEWRDKWLIEIGEKHVKYPKEQEVLAKVILVAEALDFFYSLHLDHIKAIREKIAAKKEEIMEYYKTYDNTEMAVSQALDDVLLTIAE